MSIVVKHEYKTRCRRINGIKHDVIFGGNFYEKVICSTTNVFFKLSHNTLIITFDRNKLLENKFRYLMADRHLRGLKKIKKL